MRTNLETKRLILRPPRFSDWPSVHEYASDPHFVRYVVWGPNTKAQTKAYLRHCLRQRRERPRRRYDWGLVEKSSGRFIGMCGLTIVSRVNGEGGELGYGIHPELWGKGYTTEATKVVLQFGFKKLGLRRITATCDIQNKASARVMEKVGMFREGHLRKNLFQKGKWRDTFLYALLRHNT